MSKQKHEVPLERQVSLGYFMSFIPHWHVCFWYRGAVIKSVIAFAGTDENEVEEKLWEQIERFCESNHMQLDRDEWTMAHPPVMMNGDDNGKKVD